MVHESQMKSCARVAGESALHHDCELYPNDDMEAAQPLGHGDGAMALILYYTIWQMPRLG